MAFNVAAAEVVYREHVIYVYIHSYVWHMPMYGICHGIRMAYAMPKYGICLRMAHAMAYVWLYT